MNAKREAIQWRAGRRHTLPRSSVRQNPGQVSWLAVNRLNCPARQPSKANQIRQPGVTAHSGATARDLHPLPYSLRREAEHLGLAAGVIRFRPPVQTLSV